MEHSVQGGWWNVGFHGEPSRCSSCRISPRRAFCLLYMYFCSALTLHALLQQLSAVEVLVESVNTAAIPRFLVAFTPEAIAEGSGF